MKTKSLHIEGRRWFERTNGNTYHSVKIWRDGEQIASLPYAYGYGDQYLQTAMQWLIAQGIAPEGTVGCTLEVRETLGGTYSVVDVGRKMDL